MSNALYALIITLSSARTAIASLVMGYFSDRVPDRRFLVITTALLGGVVYGLIYLIPTQLTYIVSFCAILPFGGALFSQTFSFSRVYYNLRNPARAEFTMSALRTLFGVLGGRPAPRGLDCQYLRRLRPFRRCCAGLSRLHPDVRAAACKPEARVGPAAKQSGTDTDTDTAPAGWHIPGSKLIGIGGVALVRVAFALHLTTLPLALINDFGGTLKDMGINASLAAGLEVSYAVSTAALLSITISYMQESVKGRVGLSTSLMDVTMVVSAFVASAVFAALSSKGNYTTVFVAASILSLIGAGLLALSCSPRFVRVAEASKVD